MQLLGLSITVDLLLLLLLFLVGGKLEIASNMSSGLRE